jgi:hypothetical protein
MDKSEVFSRLRDHGEPVTYFGESDWQRFRRLYQLEQAKHHLENASEPDENEPSAKKEKNNDED